MSSNVKSELWLIGAGPMAVDYVKVLKALEANFRIIGRSEISAKSLKEKTGCDVVVGGVEAVLNKNDPPEFAIVATGIEQLTDVTLKLLKAGVKNILVEKPGGFYEQIEGVVKSAEEKEANVFIAYNRRFYAGVLKAKEIIEQDGGVTAFNFEFTEWAHTIEPLQKANGVKEQWLFANSSHVIDLAFYLGGWPNEISSYVSGSLNWHPSGSSFSGAGVSETGALFSYHATWNSPGRWGVEVLTKQHRLIFRPMEKLQIQKIGSVNVEEIKVDYELDNEFKPGLFLQVKAFLSKNSKSTLYNIMEHFKNVKTIKRINFGKDYII